MVSVVDEWWRSFGELYLKGREIDRLDAVAEAEAEAAWKLLDLPPGARVVDAPCGFGRHAVRLAAWGFEVWGVDVDPVLLEEARTRAQQSGVDLELSEGDLRRLPVPDGWADAVVNLASSIGLFDADADNRAIFTEAARVLKAGGRLLVETTHRDRLVRAARHREWDERPDGTLVLQHRSFDPVTGRLDARLVVVDPDGARTETHLRPRVYSLTELVAEVTAAGFTDVRCFGGWGGEAPSPDTEAVVVAATPPETREQDHTP